MADLLKTGSDWLAAQMKAHASQSVIYSRGGSTVVILALPGRTEFEQEDAGGVQTSFHTRDFIVDAADLVLNLVAIVPQRGDRITDPDGHIYEVLPDRGQPTHGDANPYHTRLRIHTKRIAVP